MIFMTEVYTYGQREATSNCLSLGGVLFCYQSAHERVERVYGVCFRVAFLVSSSVVLQSKVTQIFRLVVTISHKSACTMALPWNLTCHKTKVLSELAGKCLRSWLWIHSRKRESHRRNIQWSWRDVCSQDPSHEQFHWFLPYQIRPYVGLRGGEAYILLLLFFLASIRSWTCEKVNELVKWTLAWTRPFRIQ